MRNNVVRIQFWRDGAPYDDGGDGIDSLSRVPCVGEHVQMRDQSVSLAVAAVTHCLQGEVDAIVELE